MRKNTVHITEWLKTAFALAALIIAINEFIIKDRQAEVARLENTRAFLLRGSDIHTLESAGKLMAYSENPSLIEPGRTGQIDVLVELTPLREYLVAWSACISMDLCERESSLDFLCGRLLGYEERVQRIFPAVSLSYDRQQRDSTYSGVLSECEDRGS